MQRFADAGVGDRVGDGRHGQAGEADDVARARFVHRHAIEPAERQDLRRATRLDDIAVIVERVDRLVGLHRARVHAARQDAAQEIVAIEQRHQEGERRVLVQVGRRHMVDDRLEHRDQRALARVHVGRGIAVAARGIEHREVELLVVRVERHEQVEHLVQHLLDARVGAIDLVDDDDRLQAQRQRLAGHELRLRHRAFRRIDQQHDAVDHRQDALHLAAEVGVARRVDDVDAHSLAATRRRPVDRGRLGENGDPALLFEVVRIHRALFDTLVVAESAGLAEELIDQRRLAVIDVRDDRHVAEAHGNS